jgi:hypothetical protein
MREKWRGVMYLDDGILLFRNTTEAERGVREVIEKLMELKIRISFGKSVWVPTQIITFLGWEIDSVRMIMTIPTEKVKKIRKMIKKWKSKTQKEKKVKIKDFASIVGTLSSLYRVIEQAHLRLMDCQLAKDTAVSLEGWGGSMKLERNLLIELVWWEKTMGREVAAVIKPFFPAIRITTDASPVGWGVVIVVIGRMGERKVRGNWGPKMRNIHSNIKELTAVRLAL